MSFILNALRKSEQERLSKHTETLENKILLKQGKDQNNKPGWIVILVMINLLLLAFFLWYFSQKEAKGIAEKPVTVAEKLTAPVHIKEDKPVTVTEQPRALVQIKEEPVTVSDHPRALVQINEETITVSEPPKDTLQVKQEKLVTVVEQAKDTVQINQAQPAQDQSTSLTTMPQITIAQQIKNHQQEKNKYRKRQTSLDVDRVIQPPERNQVSPIAGNKSNVEQQVKTQKPDLVVSNKENVPPYLSDMPYDFRLSVPNININVFVYTESPEGRFIMVNMHKYRVGQQINEEMQLQEIRPDSIVVEYQGMVFQIRR